MDTLTIELEIKDDKAEVVIGKTKQKIEDFVRDVESKQPTIKFSIPNQSFVDLDKLEKRAEATRLAFSDIAKVRLDNGQIGSLTKEIVFAAENAKRLDVQIRSIKKEIANPSRTSSIESLTKDLRAAEKQAVILEKRLETVNRRGAANSMSPGLFSASPNMARFQKQQVFYQANDIATMAAMGANPTQIIASQAGQIAQIFEPAKVAAFASAYAGVVTVLGAGAVAIAATYKITGDMRAEAERLLKVEEMITGAKNRQLLSQQEGLKNAEKLSKEAEKNFYFNRDFPNLSENQLKSRIETIKQLQKLTPVSSQVLKDGKLQTVDNEDYKKLSQDRVTYENQLRTLDQNQAKRGQDSFNQRFESAKKSLESEIKAEERRIEAEKKRLADIEKAKEKVKELGKGYLSVLDSIYSRAGSDNPFVSLFSEADKQLKSLRENTRGLSRDLISQFEQIEAKTSALKLFESRIDNNLGAFDLRDRAKQFRNAGASEDQKRRFEDIARRGAAEYGLDFGSLNDSQKREQYERRLLATNPSNNPNFIGALASDRLRGNNPNQSLNDRLNEQLKIINSGAGSLEEKAIADRRLISLTSSLDPNSLTSDLREKAALANEREAIRKESLEKDAGQQRKQQIEYQKQIADNTKRQNQIAEKGGTKALEITLKDETKAGGATVTQAPTASDTANQYNGNLNYDGGGGFSNR